MIFVFYLIFYDESEVVFDLMDIFY